MDKNLFHRTVPDHTGCCQVPQDAARSHRTRPGPTGYSKGTPRVLQGYSNDTSSVLQGYSKGTLDSAEAGGTLCRRAWRTLGAALHSPLFKQIE